MTQNSYLGRVEKIILGFMSIDWVVTFIIGKYLLNDNTKMICYLIFCSIIIFIFNKIVRSEYIDRSIIPKNKYNLFLYIVGVIFSVYAKYVYIFEFSKEIVSPHIARQAFLFAGFLFFFLFKLILRMKVAA